MGVADSARKNGGIGFRRHTAANDDPKVWGCSAGRGSAGTAPITTRDDSEPEHPFLRNGNHHRTAAVRISSVVEPSASAVARAPELDLFITVRRGRTEVIFQCER